MIFRNLSLLRAIGQVQNAPRRARSNKRAAKSRWIVGVECASRAAIDTLNARASCARRRTRHRSCTLHATRAAVERRNHRAVAEESRVFRGKNA
jgi:hypothetical protein